MSEFDPTVREDDEWPGNLAHEAEYRIDFSIMRRLPGEDDFTEHGFGSTTAEESIDQAAHMALGAMQNGEWDRTDD